MKANRFTVASVLNTSVVLLPRFVNCAGMTIPVSDNTGGVGSPANGYQPVCSSDYVHVTTYDGSILFNTKDNKMANLNVPVCCHNPNGSNCSFKIFELTTLQLICLSTRNNPIEFAHTSKSKPSTTEAPEPLRKQNRVKLRTFEHEIHAPSCVMILKN